MNSSAKIIAMLIMTLGCAELPMDVEHPYGSEKAAFELSNTEAMQAALTDLRDDLPQADYRTLLQRGSVVESGETSGTDALPRALQRLLLSTIRNRQDGLQDSEVQVQRFQLNEAFQPLALMGRGVQAAIPFRMKAGATVEFARVKRDGAWGREHHFSLMDLPHDADSALRLPEGTIVTLPITARVSLDVGGSFLSRAAVYSPELTKYVKTSAYGHTSSVRRGTLIGEGDFRLQVLRLSDQRVRLRVVSSATLTTRAVLSSSASEGLRYMFLPAAEVDKVRALGRKLQTLRTHVDMFRNADERVASLRDVSPEIVRTIIDAVPFAGTPQRRQRLDELAAGFDSALEKAQSFTEPLERLDALIGDHVDGALSKVEDVWSERVIPSLDRIRRLSSRVFSLNQSLLLSDEVGRRLRLLADYEFDLSSPDAQEAFERALSGQTVWRGASRLLRDWDFDHEPFADFTLAESLAASDEGSNGSAVKRIAAGGSDMRRRRYDAHVSGLGMELGFNGEFRRNRITIRGDDGRERELQGRLWERGRRNQWFGDVRSEVFASGAFTDATDGQLTEGGYWFRWNKTFSSNAQQPVADTLAHAINDLGPALTARGLADIYRGEQDGKVSAELMVMINGPALRAIFDESLTSDEVIWRSLETMMNTYKRPMSLPYAHAPIRPAAVRENPIISAGCEAVARRIGGRYCYSFVDRIIPALRQAQRSGSSEDKLAFFESFYRVRAGGASLSTRVLVRFIMDLLNSIGRIDGVHAELRIVNQSDDSSAASPIFRYGDEESLELGRTTATEGLRPL